MVWYFKRVVWYFNEVGVVLWRDGVVLWRVWCGTLKRVMWYYEEVGVALWRGWCGILKMVLWFFEEGGVLLWRRWCDTLKMLVWHFDEGDVVLWRGWVVLWRWWRFALKMVTLVTRCILNTLFNSAYGGKANANLRATNANGYWFKKNCRINCGSAYTSGLHYFQEGGWVVGYFEEGKVVLWIWRCGTL